MNSLEIAQQLIRYDSVSSQSNVEVTEFVREKLAALRFEIESLSYRDDGGIEKRCLVARRGPEVDGGVCYAAHTDVVPADDWSLDFCTPFQGIVRDDRLWGRGACDMKGSLACAIAAVASIDSADQIYPIYFIITADEEVGMEGARFVDAKSKFFQTIVERNPVTIIGEPTELQVVHAHKGCEVMHIISRGISAHSSSSDGLNANVAMVPILSLLGDLELRCRSDGQLRNYDFDPPILSINFVIRNEPFASNVTPSLAEVVLFLRSMPNVDHRPLMELLKVKARELRLEVHTRHANTFFTSNDDDHIQQMLELTEQERSTTVCFATDASMLGRLKQKVIFGPGSIEQAHTKDEWISLDQLTRGETFYRKIFTHYTKRGQVS